MTAAPPRPGGDRVAAERWFLRHGLPSVLTPRARWRRLWSRSAPTLAALAVLLVAIGAVSAVSGGAEVDIDADLTRADVVVLAVVALAPLLAGVAAWLMGRIAGDGARRTIGVAAVAVGALAAAVGGPANDVPGDLVATALGVGAVLTATGLGLGSVLGWAVRLTLTRLGSVGDLFTRALPVLLLTVLVFFNGPVWSMAATIGRGRMWLLIALLASIAGAFVFTGVVERVRAALRSNPTDAGGNDGDAGSDVGTEPTAAAAALAGTPFAAMPAGGSVPPLTRGERANVVFVVAAAQFVQLAVVAAVTSVIFLAIGLVAVTPRLLTRLTVDGDPQGTLLGMTLPIPQALIHVAMFLGALTFMYVSARSVGDGEYRSRFLDPLIEDLRTVLLARSRYRAALAR